MNKFQSLLCSIKRATKRMKVEKIVRTIQEIPGIRLYDLSEKVGHDPAGISNYIKFLREEGIVLPRQKGNGHKCDGYRLVCDHIID